MSTTTDRDIAMEFGDFTGSEKPIVLVLDTPAGTHGRDLSPFDVEDDPQKEVLLERGQQYDIIDIKGEDGQIVVYAKIRSRK